MKRCDERHDKAEVCNATHGVAALVALLGALQGHGVLLHLGQVHVGADAHQVLEAWRQKGGGGMIVRAHCNEKNSHSTLSGNSW